MHTQEDYTMNSIADIFDNSKPLLDGITHFFDIFSTSTLAVASFENAASESS